jgi:hypothetical protein
MEFHSLILHNNGDEEYRFQRVWNTKLICGII